MNWYLKGNKKTPVLEVWESFNGDLYFIIEKKGDEVFCFVRLYSMPQFAEFGWNSMSYLKKAYGLNMLWIVTKKNWSNINSYEEGLLVSEDEV